MAGSLRVVFAGVLTAALITSPAAAFGGRFGFRPAYVASYAPAPAWHCQVPIAAPLIATPIWVYPLPAAQLPPTPKNRSLAEPLPAPASKTNEPPLNPVRAPAVTESRSLSGAAPAQMVQVTAGRCKVGFWNITGAEVTLTVDGQSRTLAKDRAVTLELDHTFVWQISGRPARTEQVPESQQLFEVILRP